VHPATAPIDWVNVCEAGGALAAIWATALGTVAAVKYRRATVSVSAEVHGLDRGGLTIAVRVSAAAIARRLELGDASVKVTEILRNGTSTTDGDSLPERLAVFGKQEWAQHAKSGETVTNALVFLVSAPGDSVVGWRVFLHVRDKSVWADTVFIARPIDATLKE
jgi:hypothetical protein